MGLQRGERQAQRTKEALESAFVQLTHEKIMIRTYHL